MKERFESFLNHSNLGLTVIEIIVSLVIISIVLSLGFSFFTFGTNIFSRGEERSNEQQIVRFVTNFIMRELRFATSLEILDTLVENDDFESDLNYIFVEDGKFMFREAYGDKIVRFSDMDERVILDFLSFEESNGLITYTVRAIDAGGLKEKYSLNTGLRLLNDIAIQTQGNGGVAIAYRSERWIPISDAQDLSYIGLGYKTFSNGETYNATLTAKYYLRNSINLAGMGDWDPIGTNEENPFRGYFYGNGFTIHDLFIDRPFHSSANNNQGLFGVTKGARLQDIKLKNTSVIGYQKVGGLVGHSINTQINNCSVEGEIRGENSNSQKIGGLVGFNEGGSLIRDSFFKGEISNNGHETGGLVGNNTSSTILRSYANGSINGQNEVGGLVGRNDGSTINECYASVDVTGKDHVGGLVGRNQPNSMIRNCYATGVIDGESEVGGLVGRNQDLSYVDRCYSIGEVTGSTRVGGLVGWENVSAATTFSYWDQEASLLEDSAGDAEGKTTDEMIDKGTYDHWNFSTVWTIKDDHYPCLRWQDGVNCPNPDINIDMSFSTFVLEENVFVYGANLFFQGGSVIGHDATMLIRGDINTSDTNDGSSLDVSYIYVDGNITLSGGSAGLGSKDHPGEIHVNGDLELWTGSRNIYGDVYVNGDFRLKDARIHGNIYVDGDVELGWTPYLAADARIYYTGELTHPNHYNLSILEKCIGRGDPDFQEPFPVVNIPDQELPPMKGDSFFEERGYVSEGTLTSGLKIFADSYTSSSWSPTAENVIIVAKDGDISITGLGSSGVTGVLYAPKGKVTFNGGSFKGLVIARDGFSVTSGGTEVTFKSIEKYIDDQEDFPF